MYPFKLHDKEMSGKEQGQLVSRLVKEKKDHNMKNYLSRQAEYEKMKNPVKTPKNDVVKQTLRKNDAQLDKVISSMIQKGELSYTKIHKDRSKSKSPFRKTCLH